MHGVGRRRSLIGATVVVGLLGLAPAAPLPLGLALAAAAEPGEDAVPTEIGTALVVAPSPGTGTGTGLATPTPGGAQVGLVAVGAAPDLGVALTVNQAAVGAAPSARARGVWVVAADGGVFTAGDAPFLGSLGAVALARPIVGIAATPAGDGYWLVASDGGVFTFGTARFAGSLGAIPLRRPIVAMAPTPTGDGYWLVAADGGVFTFGDAPFLGSLGDVALNRPIVGMASTPSGRGYWLVGSDGGVFAFGDARFEGSGLGRFTTAAVGVAPVHDGYVVVSASGELAAFGDDVPGLADPLATLGRARVVAATPTGAGGAWLATSTDGDDVWVSQSRGLTPAVAGGAVAAAARAGARAAVLQGGTVGLLGVQRGAQAVQVPPEGMQFPMSVTALGQAGAAHVYGPAVAAALATGGVVMGARSAALRGARAGDTIDVLGWDGRVRRLAIALVAPEPVVAGELVVDDAVAASFGLVRPANVVLWGFSSRAAADAALEGLPPAAWVDVDRSWDPPGPDRTATSAAFKEQFGEFAYASAGGGGIVQQADWVAANIVVADVPIIGAVRCHRALLPALRGALGEVEALGLGGLIDVSDTRRNGGCFAPREVRNATGGTTGGSLSRHSWGAAIDINPSSNAFGGRPSMDPRIVDVFRRWGFAWGGSFTIPDGMHFEWARPLPTPVPAT